MSGTGTGMGDKLLKTQITYAGSKILSMEEIDY